MDVLLSGFAHGQVEMRRSESFSFKRQVLTASLPLFELYALLVSHFDAPENRRHILALSETVRVRNLGKWANASTQLESAPAGEDGALIASLLQKLRALEVELDFRYLAGSLSTVQANASQAARRDTQAALQDLATRHKIRFKTEEDFNGPFLENADAAHNSEFADVDYG